jgi:hypothetical protein
VIPDLPWRTRVSGDGYTRITNASHDRIGVCEDAETAAFIVRACSSHRTLLRELQHLIKLLEPLEQSGQLHVPGLATLNGARAAIGLAISRTREAH